MFFFTEPEADIGHKNGFVLRTFEDTVAIGIATFFYRINAFLTVNVHCFHSCYQVFHFHTIGSDILHSTRPTSPGMSERFSAPYHPCSTQYAYKIIPYHACSYTHGNTPYLLPSLRFLRCGNVTPLLHSLW